MYFTCIACYCVTFTYKLKFGHNFWTACPIRKILFNFVFRGCVVICFVKRHYNLINIKEDYGIRKLRLCNISKLVVRFQKCLQNRTQRLWFQDNFSINFRKLFFVRILIAEWKFLSLRSFSIINYTKFEGHALSPPLGRFR